MKWSEVTQSCPTLCDPVDCSPPGYSVHGILQARILEWIAISFSRGSSRPRDRTQVSCIASRRFNLWATSEGLVVKSLLKCAPDAEDSCGGSIEPQWKLKCANHGAISISYPLVYFHVPGHGYKSQGRRLPRSPQIIQWFRILCASLQNLCVCVCVSECVCPCACLCVYICVWVCVWVCGCVWVCMCAYICLCAHMCTHACTHIQSMKEWLWKRAASEQSSEEVNHFIETRAKVKFNEDEESRPNFEPE